jgi:hypothetical protein
MRHLALVLGLVLGVASVSPAAVDKPVLGKVAAGKVALQSIDVLRFAPQGVLLIADGKGGQVVALDTQDLKPLSGGAAKVPDLAGQIAAKLGAKSADVELIDMAVNPLSKRAYLAVRRHDAKTDLVVTVDPAGKIEPLALDSVRHVRIQLPASGSPGSAVRISDLAWAGDRLVAAARSNEEFASKILVIPGPLGPDSAAGIFSAETYHVAHGKWETKAPMSSLMPYEENGKFYVVGAFNCTPIVKYPLEALSEGAKVKGISMLELGSGNRPLNMFTYDKEGKSSVLVNTFRFHHERRPVSPGPYWTCRFDRDILAANDKVNEKATRRDIANPKDPKITIVDAFHGVAHMDRLDDKHALVVRADADKKLTLEPVALP